MPATDLQQNADMTNIAGYERFTVNQKITMMVNRYEIRSVEANGSAGTLIAVAQQKRMAFKEQVTFYADEARTPAGVRVQGEATDGPQRHL
jgi:hypothetical protein